MLMKSPSPAPPWEAQMPCWLASGELDCVFLEDYGGGAYGSAQSCPPPLGSPNALLANILLILGNHQAKFLVSDPYAIWNPISQSVS